MNYYEEIKNKIIDNETYEKVKDYSKERHRVITYYEIGKLLNEAGGKYGDNIINEYSKKLVVEVNKKYNRRTLFRMKQFYKIFSNKKVSQVATQLSWSHYVELLPLKDLNEIKYYIKICKEQSIGRDLLREKIKSKEYERLPKEAKEKIIRNEACELIELVKNPIVIKTNRDYENISEKILQKIILEDMPSFMKELGSGYSFIDNEYKIKLGGRYNYIDLLLFNIDYNCYVVVELKATELKKEHIGQIQIYMNYIDAHLRKFNQDKTIGIILCKKENKYVIEYCSDARIIERKYVVVGGII